jgi:hypothetical protein
MIQGMPSPGVEKQGKEFRTQWRGKEGIAVCSVVPFSSYINN